MKTGIITVVGSYIVDLMSRTPRMPKPGETVLGGPFRMGPGGKGGNQAVAAARQGSDVRMVTKVGNDSFGRDALQHFQNESIDTAHVFVDENEATGTALIAVDDQGENMIVVSPGACGNLNAADVKKAEASIRESDILLVQLETSLEAVQEAVRLARIHDVPVILNPAPYQPVPLELLKNVTCLTPNETEASLLTGIQVQDDASAEEAAKIMHNWGVPHVIVTLGKRGCYYYNGIVGKRVEGFQVEAIDTTGAGDAFNGGLAHALASGQSWEEAIIRASAVAALSVNRIGAAPSMPAKWEVDELLGKR